MRTWKISPTHISILNMISKGMPIRKIARSLGLNHSTIIRHLMQLEKREYVSRQVRSSQVLYSILPLGMELMHHPVRKDENEVLTEGSKNAPPPEEMKIRLHRLQIKFDLVTPVEDPTLIRFNDFPSKIVPLEHWSKNIIQFEDFTAIISTRSLIITGVQRYLEAADNIEAQEADALSAVIPFAEQVEARVRKIHPKFRLKRIDRGVLSGKILSREFAYEHHPIAEKIKRMRIDGPEGKPRIIVDQSKGFPELETVDRNTASEDMEKLRQNTKILATTDLKDALNIISNQASIVEELAKHSVTAQDQMDQVIALVGKIAEIVAISKGGN